MTPTRYPKAALAVAIAALGLASASIAQTAGTPSAGGAKATAASNGGSKTSSLQGSDRTFVMKAAQGGLAEVEAGKLAQRKAQDEAVKRFAQHMVDDHSKANEELASLARSKNVDVPSALDRQHKARMERLEKLSGPAFDREYMKLMVNDHGKTVADFEKHSKGGKDGELKQWAGSKLPALREHLKMAQATQAQVSKAGGKSAASTKTGGRSDPAKPVNSANAAGNTTGSNTANIAGAAPKPATTGK